MISEDPLVPIELAVALSALDGEVDRRKEGKLGFAGAGRPWSEATVQAEQSDTSQSSLSEKQRLLEGVLTGGLTFSSRVLGFDEIPSLHGFLQSALERAATIGVGDQYKKVGAGAIYLHDWLHDELVMAASYGFPLVAGENSGMADFLGCLPDEPSGTMSGSADSIPLHQELAANIARLHYVQTELRPRVAPHSMKRHLWIRDELQGRYNPGTDVTSLLSSSSLDCNEALVGVAYYERHRGITGQLFDRVEGERLERTRYTQRDSEGSKESFAKVFEERLQVLLESGSDELRRHLQDELLRKRTVVFALRDEMASGRQVKAGTYERLQFPLSDFIGPFMGTVLRFNGEHLGILKVEKHKFKKDAEPCGDDKCKRLAGRPEECPYLQQVSPFTGSDTARFLIFAYALAGVLYAMKHHAGMDLSDGWRLSLKR